MANQFSDHFNSSGSVAPGFGTFTEELTYDAERKVSGGRAHGRQRRSTAVCDVGSDAAVGDQVRMLTLPSNAILSNLFFSTDGGATAHDADLGIYIAGDRHDGALPAAATVDAFSTTALVLDTLAGPTDQYGTGDYDGAQKGLELWELINVTAAATYAVDPLIKFDIVFTITVEATVAASRLVLEAVYTVSD